MEALKELIEIIEEYIANIEYKMEQGYITPELAEELVGRINDVAGRLKGIDLSIVPKTNASKVKNKEPKHDYDGFVADIHEWIESKGGEKNYYDYFDKNAREWFDFGVTIPEAKEYITEMYDIKGEDNFLSLVKQQFVGEGKEIKYGSPGYLMRGKVKDITKSKDGYEVDYDLYKDGKWDEGHFFRIGEKELKELIENGEVQYTDKNGGYVEIAGPFNKSEVQSSVKSKFKKQMADKSEEDIKKSLADLKEKLMTHDLDKELYKEKIKVLEKLLTPKQVKEIEENVEKNVEEIESVEASKAEYEESVLWDIVLNGFSDETEIYFEYGSDKAIDIIITANHEELPKDLYPAYAYVLWTDEQGFRYVEAVDNEEEKDAIVKTMQGDAQEVEGKVDETFDEAKRFAKEDGGKYIGIRGNDLYGKAKMTKEGQDYMSKKIKKLMEDEGMKKDQAVAVAYKYAQKEGYKTPKNTKASAKTVPYHLNYDIKEKITSKYEDALTKFVEANKEAPVEDFQKSYLFTAFRNEVEKLLTEGIKSGKMNIEEIDNILSVCKIQLNENALNRIVSADPPLPTSKAPDGQKWSKQVDANGVVTWVLTPID
jgi:hypothetical protein